jgi:L-alanine-DL-glutamate epimerase-like enolase superfamily enzyme
VKIKDIRASVLRFPVPAPLIERPIDTCEIVFCPVETDEGHLGYGLTGRFFPRAVASAPHMAQTFNLPIADGGGWPRFDMHTMAGLMNGWRVEFHRGMAQVVDRIFKDRPWPEDNMVKIPKAPGLGLELSREEVEEARVRD